MNKVVFAIDLGNSNVKMKSERAEYIFPAQYIIADNILQKKSILMENYGNDLYQINDEDEEFIWGENLEVYAMPEKLIDSRAYSNRFAQSKVRRILEFSISKLASDYPEAVKGEMEICLVLGVSISQNHEFDNTCQLIKDMCIGKHISKINGKNIKVSISSQENIIILPQYMGTVINLAFDNKLEENKEITNSNIGVLDIGSETVLANVVNRMVPSVWGTEQLKGIRNLIKNISSQTNCSDELLIEKIFFNPKGNDSYIKQIYSNLKENISDTVLSEVNKYTKFVIAPFITDYFSNLKNITSIIVTGGGANIISHDILLKNEIGETYFNHLNFIKEPELANVRGFYKYGLLSQKKEICEQEDPVDKEKEIVYENTNEETTPNLKSIVSNIEKLKENMDSFQDEIGNTDKGIE